MGYGDELMGSGIARGAAARGKRIAFGDGRRIIWAKPAYEVFRNNPNVAPPGDENAVDLEWVRHYSGARLYHTGRPNGRWTYSDWKCSPGEWFPDASETQWASRLESGYVVIEPNVKPIASSKQWPKARYHEVARQLQAIGLSVVQFSTGDYSIPGVDTIITPSFRFAMAALSKASLFVGPEGGLHHGAAALDVPAVVIFGGFTHPRNTGYDSHINLFVGKEPCGMMRDCPHCQEAMKQITVDQVYGSAVQLLKGGVK